MDPYAQEAAQAAASGLTLGGELTLLESKNPLLIWAAIIGLAFYFFPD